MTWFKVDDTLALHPKVVRAGNASMGLWVRAGAWSAQQLTDGYVPSEIVQILGNADLAEELVRAGLWSVAAGGFEFHDWEERQPSKSEVESKREAQRERVRRWRAQRDGNAVTDAATGELPERPRNAVSNALPERPSNALVTPPRPDPTRPDPTLSTSNEVLNEVGAKKRATRIPDPFIVTAEMRRWAAEKTPAVDVTASTEKFVDYWRAKAGRDATKKDWVATWRNWLRSDQERARPAGQMRAQERTRANLSVVERLRAEEQQAVEA